PQQFLLPSDHETLIVERVISSFVDQRCDVFLVQKEFIKPRNLRQNLQISEVLRLKVSLCTLGRFAMLAESFQQFPVTRISPDQIGWVCLKKILQGEAALLHG